MICLGPEIDTVGDVPPAYSSVSQMDLTAELQRRQERAGAQAVCAFWLAGDPSLHASRVDPHEAKWICFCISLCSGALLLPGYDSPGIAPRGACPPPKIRKALSGPPGRFQKCSSTLCLFDIAFMGRHPACPGPKLRDPSHSLRACRTLVLASPVMAPCSSLISVSTNVKAMQICIMQTKKEMLMNGTSNVTQSIAYSKKHKSLSCDSCLCNVP